MSQNFSSRQAAVIGAGVMGHGIVMRLANAGLDVQWPDGSPQMPNQALGAVTDTCVHNVRQGRIGEEEAAVCRTRITPVQHLAAMRGADLVIEVVYENLELKQSTFHELDAALRPSAVPASNISYLDISAIVTVIARPGQVLGLHPFSPAHIMRLLETVCSAQTVSAVLEMALAPGEQMDRVSAAADNCHGFIGNHMFELYATEVHLMLLEGVLPYQVDRALQAFGFTMRSFRMYSVVGIDLEWCVRELAGVGQDQLAVQVDNRLYELGRFDRESGAGYYRYAPDSRQAGHDTKVDALVLRVVEMLGYPRRDFVDEEIFERCLLTLINEGAKILDEGIAACSADTDTVYLNGYSFPVAEGGPMVWANRPGAAELLQRLCLLERRHGARWRPASLVERLVAEGGTFTDLQEVR